MAEISTLARPYAKAAFQFALDAKALGDWSESLATLASVSQDKKVAGLLHEPSATAESKAQALLDVCSGELKADVSNLISILSENKRLDLFEEIADQFEKLKAEQEKSVEVNVTTAYELSKAQQKALVEKLTAKLGRDVTLVSVVDESLIGGVVIRTDELVIDASITGKLAKLAEAMYS